MPDCQPRGSTPSQTLRFFLGPYNSAEISAFSSIAFLSGRCTLRSLGGHPVKAERSRHTVGTSILKFADMNTGVGGFLLYRRGDFIIMNDLLWRITEIYGPSDIALSDPTSYWPTQSATGEISNTEFFLDFLPERGLDPTELKLDGYTYNYTITNEGKRPTSGLLEFTIDSEGIPFIKSIPDDTEEIFYLQVNSTAPSEFQAATSPGSNATTVSYHIGQKVTTVARVQAVAAPVITYAPAPAPSSESGTGTGSSEVVENALPAGCVGLGCDDPFGLTGAADIEPDCSSINLFNPYAQNKSGNLYKQLNNIVSDIFGHTVNYFRTTADLATKDVTLMEYSLHKVAANENIKILVPDNEFPEEANTFDIFGMEFAEFEVHIVHEKFQAIFGNGVRPRVRDYMFIPIINKMYEVNSVSIADEFNYARSYWRLKLTKYQDRTSVTKDTFGLETDSLITGIEEVFGEEIQDEQKKDSNPVQFQTITKVLEDGSRSYVDSGLTIVDEAIVNNFTTISHNHYDLSKVTTGASAIRYSAKSNMIINGQIAVTAWFRPTFEITDNFGYDIISDNIAQGGFDIKISTLKLSVIINGQATSFTHNTNLSKTKWYGIGVNIMNNSDSIEVILFSLSVSGHVTSMVQEFTQTKPMTGGQQYWDVNSPYVLKGGKLNLTCLRIFDKAIDTTEFKNVLNQYVVRDNQHALVIDNAIPSLGYQKFKNAR